MAPWRELPVVERISRDKLQRLIEKDAVQLVDVLGESEYRQGHIPGALNIPLRTLDEETTRALSKDKPIAVY
jgi:rhodanese-related sulfurtransferase